MIQKPNSNKNRINTACESCKKRKVKCDGGRPCSSCNRFNQNCIYPIKYYLSHLKNASTTTATSYLNPSNVDIPFSPSPYFSFSIDKYRFHRRYQNVLPYYFADNLMQQLSSSIIKQYDLERPRIQNYAWNMAGGHFPKFDPCFLNEPQFFDFNNINHINLIKKILQWYFKHCNPIFGILHESVFYSQFNNKFLPNFNPVGKSDKLFQSLLYLIIIITIRFNAGLIFKNDIICVDLSNGIDFNDWEFKFLLGTEAANLEQHLFVYSYNLIQKLTFEWESFELIQSWLLIAFYLRTCYRQTSTWNALSKAVSLVKGMSLEMNMFPLKHHPYDELKAFHCFWSCFIMDKIVSFQMGRTYQLELPLNNMLTPRHTSTDQSSHTISVQSEDDWFHEETRQMYDLSLIIYKFQQCKCFEMDFSDSMYFRKCLSEWIQSNSIDITKDNLTVLQLQPLLTYLDVVLTFEMRSLFPIACQQIPNPYPHPNPTVLPLDSSSLLTHVQITLDLLTYLCTNDLFFIPWWLQLSNLFTITLISLSCSYANLQTLSYRHILFQISKLWKIVKDATPWNPPVMLKQCDWCIKMLNHMVTLVIQDSALFLPNTIGIDHGDNTPNQNNFQQFNRVGENEEEEHDLRQAASKSQNNALEQTQEASVNTKHRFAEESIINTTDSFLAADLLATLHWFDENFL